MYSAQIQAVIFNGLTETKVSRNSFMTPLLNSSSTFSPTDFNAKGFNFSSSSILQLFNDQSYWLHQESIKKQYLATVLSYSGSELKNKMISDGWGAMGSYCLIISIDPILTSTIMPNLIANNEQEKVVVQLWYDGNNMLQLWSQDAALLSKNQEFNIAITSDIDPLSELANSTTQSSIKTIFLKGLHLQQKNRSQSTYQAATQSPRSVKIQAN